MPRRRPPAASECQRDTPLGKPPLITSPVIAATYTIRATATDDEDTIPLTAHTDTDVQRVHWFVDEAYVGTSAPSTPLAWKPPRGGRYLVRAIDDRGRADTRAVEVELLRPGH
jgi:penicillin-binding protein 1C